MFAREQKQEYDPTSVPVIERPLAKQIHGNAYGGLGLDGLRSEERGHPFGHGRNPSKDIVTPYTPTKLPLSSIGNSIANTGAPIKDQVSAIKSSLAASRFNSKATYDPENNVWSEENSGDERELPEGRSLHRHAKSVTFDAAPPQINEYEMVTPDLSSVGTDSRENSYDSAGDDEDESYNRSGSLEQDDSFDASLEDTDKTPVVGPDDWRHTSPASTGENPGHYSSQFEPSSPMIESETPSPTVASNTSGDHRPLPPLPGASEKRHSGLFAAAERAGNPQREMPGALAAASFSKSDIQGLTGGRMPLEERLRLMMIQDDDKPKTAAELQRERRMRRGSAREQCSATPEADDSEIKIHEDEDTLADLGDYQLPERISRESILRKVNGHDKFGLDSDYNFSSPMPSSSPGRPTDLDPDVPIPSTEDVSMVSDDGTIIKPEEDDSEVDVYSIPEMYHGRPESGLEDDDINDSIIRHGLRGDDDEESQYSDTIDPTPFSHSPALDSHSAPDDDGPPTPRATTPKSDIPMLDREEKDRQVSLPEFSGFLNNNDFGPSLQSYMTPSPPPPPPKDEQEEKGKGISEPLEGARRPSTPPDIASQYALPKPEYDGAGWGSDDEQDPGTPDSVVHHVVEVDQQSPPRDILAVPEQVATIKASSGSKLKTRPSATPSDIMSMREARRHISTEYPIPPIPQRHHSRPSLNSTRNLEEPGQSSTEEEIANKPSLKKRSLTLDIGSDLGLSLDEDFDRLIEAQKVAFDLFHPHSTSYNGFGQVSQSQANSLRYDKLYANITPRKQRGYLMRQNTKLVVASSDVDKVSQDFSGVRSAGNSPLKQTRPQSWTVEPWNGSPRKRSGARKKVASGPAPPLPGQESNVAGLGMVAESEIQVDTNEGENAERGRLFVKVIGVKDLALPLPKSKLSAHLYTNIANNWGKMSARGSPLLSTMACTALRQHGLNLEKMPPLAKSLNLWCPMNLNSNLP